MTTREDLAARAHRTDVKLIVAGSRRFTNAVGYVFGALDLWASIHGWPAEVVTGGCRGPDQIAESWAKERGISVRRFDADWRTHGPKAGPIRNAAMAEHGTALVAFWDTESRGTANMIAEARRRELPSITVVEMATRSDRSSAG